MLGDNLFDVSYETQFKTVDKDDMLAVVNNIRKEYNSKNEEDKFLLQSAMKDKCNAVKVGLLTSVVFIIGLTILASIPFVNIICLLLGLVTVLEAYMLKKEYRYAKLYLDVVEELKKI